MVSFTTVSVAIVSVLSISQGVQATAAIPMAISAGSQIIGGILGGGQQHKRDVSFGNNIFERATAAAPQNDEATRIFNSCFSTVKKATKKPVLAKKPGNVVEMTGLPADCITAIKMWNAKPNIKELQKTQGIVTVNGPNKATFKNVPAKILDAMDG